MRKIAIVLSILVLSGAASIAVEGNRTGLTGPSSAPQDPMYLDRRISLLEQRFNILESNVSRLQQQAMSIERTPAQPARDPNVDLLRAELEILKSRLKEIECGVVRLDERTLSPASRESMKRTGSQGKDPCRQFPEVPIEFSPRR